MELNPEQASEEESSQGGVSDTDDVGSVSVPVDDEGFETLAAEIKEVLAELAQVFTFSFVVIIIRLISRHTLPLISCFVKLKPYV